ncbi:MAG: hypothetical protein COA74_01695 [Gammaproteobacteria bacterium]|nr:MAG: hypothetical protein COA74_01695 [Gammaproteobacteria bacterium]
MPRLLINGFPESSQACFHIRINASAKGSGSQLKMLFDKTISPKNGMYELPIEKRYLGSLIRLEINLPGYKLIDKNIMLHSNVGYNSIFLTKLTESETEKDVIVQSYGSLDNWQSEDSKALYKEAKLQFNTLVAEQRKIERNTFLGALLVVLVFAGAIYLLIGAIGLLILLIFAFYYHEKNKLNSWSDVSK